MITTIKNYKETYAPGEGHKVASMAKQQDVAMLVSEWPESKIQEVFSELLETLYVIGYDPRKEENGTFSKTVMVKVLQDYFKGKVESGKYSEIKKYFENPKSKVINDSFRQGSASAFDAKLKEWSAKYGVKYEWKFKEKDRSGNYPSYFVLDLNYDKYDALPNEAKVALNGIMKAYNVDFKYSNRNWTPVIEGLSTDNTFDIYALTSLQFYKLMDLLEADITMYDSADISYYEELTGIDVGTLVDLYAGYGYNGHKWKETEKMWNAYCKKHGKTQQQVSQEADEALYGKPKKWQHSVTEGFIFKTVKPTGRWKSFDNASRLNMPLIPDAVELIKRYDPLVVHDIEEFEKMVDEQRYFNASASHCFYSEQEYKEWSKNGCKYQNRDSERSVILKDSRDLVAVWDNKNGTGYIVPKKRIHEALFYGETPESSELIEKLNSIDAPYVYAYESSLGGRQNASVLLTVSMSDKSGWKYGILENSKYIKFHIGTDGKIESFSGSLDGILKFRKCTAKSIDDVVGKINAYLQKVSDILEQSSVKESKSTEYYIMHKGKKQRVLLGDNDGNVEEYAPLDTVEVLLNDTPILVKKRQLLSEGFDPRATLVTSRGTKKKNYADLKDGWEGLKA